MSFSHIAAYPFEPVPLESTRVHIMTLVPVLTQRVSKLMPRILLLFPPFKTPALSELSIFFSCAL